VKVGAALRTVSGRTARRLASGPTLLLTAEVSDEMTDALVAYDPALRVRSDRFAFGNGVLLHGPVDVTPELAAKAGLPATTASAYYADIIETGTRGSRPDSAKRQDAERLVRGLAARLGGSVHDQSPAMSFNLSASVYTTRLLPAEQVISVLQPYTDEALFADEDQDVPGAYILVSEQEPRFLTVFWPPRLSRSALEPPPLALGDLRHQEPARWELRSKFPAATADRAIRLTVGEAALALARPVDGVVIDPYGFPVTRPEDLIPR
jgi:hypothetical protein